MTLSPKVKEELHSVVVTFITTFIMTAVPLINQHLETKSVFDWAIITSVGVAAMRSGIKAIYQLLVSEYTKK